MFCFLEVREGVREEAINQKIMDFLIESELSIFSVYRSYKHFCGDLSFGC